VNDVMADRYGTAPPTRRRTVIIASGVVGLLALAWLAWVVWFQSTPDVQSSLRSFKVLDTQSVRAEVTVKPRSAEVEANCLLRAYGKDHSVVGERNFPVRDTDDSTDLVVEFRTEREATSVELVGCTTDQQSRPR
jgi:hypothetical protein